MKSNLASHSGGENPSAQTALPKPENVVGAFLRAIRRIGFEDEVFQFLTFLLPRLPRARGQVFQDVWALWESGNKRDGYFVEFGVADGVYRSNTYLLEKEMGWTGVVAEPNPVFAQSLVANRSCSISTKCLFVRSGERIGFLAGSGGEADKSRIASIVPDDAHERRGERTAPEIQVETISLNDLLAEANAPFQIDYMSVDTEGSELEILSPFDFDRWNVRLISVEHNRTPARERIHDLLASHGYERKWPELSAFDDWYVRRQVMAVPQNVAR